MAAPADQVLIVLLSAFVGYGSKWAQDWWTARNARKKEAAALWSLHKQQFHLPLLDAGRQLEARLSELAEIYRGKSPRHRPESLSGDFRELYLLRRDEIPWSQDKDEGPSILDSDANQPRRDDDAVQRVRKRMCYELTLATSSLYWTARYLAHARLAHLHLSGGGSSLDTADREGLDRLIAAVGAKLQGDGAGMFSEQQESVAEMMVDSGGKVLSNYDFRRRLLEVPGWEQFTALFLFFISEDNQLDIATLGDREKSRARFVAKLDNEVGDTIEGLARLRTRLSDICGLDAAALNV
jgi:hypothetical protein